MQYKRILAVGDIHGMYEKLIKLMEQIRTASLPETGKRIRDGEANPRPFFLLVLEHVKCCL